MDKDIARRAAHAGELSRRAEQRAIEAERAARSVWPDQIDVDDPSSADVAAHGGPTREPPGQPVPDRGRGP